jgi:hypothetical protein
MPTSTSITTTATLTISALGTDDLGASLAIKSKTTAQLGASLSILVTADARVSQLAVEYAQTAGTAVKAKVSQLAVEYAQSNQSLRARVSQLAVEYAQKVGYTLAIVPANSTSNGYVPITFHAILTGSNGTIIENPQGTWSISGDVGTIDPASGVFSPNGETGTVVVSFTTAEF